MKKNTKALLASALIFPGAGQLLLKRYKSFVVFMGVALTATTFIFIDVMSKALQITDRILTGEVEPNIFVIRKLIAEQQVASPWMTIFSILLGIVWLVSIIDVYQQRK